MKVSDHTHSLVAQLCYENLHCRTPPDFEACDVKEDTKQISMPQVGYQSLSLLLISTIFPQLCKGVAITHMSKLVALCSSRFGVVIDKGAPHRMIWSTIHIATVCALTVWGLR